MLSFLYKETLRACIIGNTSRMTAIGNSNYKVGEQYIPLIEESGGNSNYYI